MKTSILKDEKFTSTVKLADDLFTSTEIETREHATKRLFGSVLSIMLLPDDPRAPETLLMQLLREMDPKVWREAVDLAMLQFALAVLKAHPQDNKTKVDLVTTVLLRDE